MKTKTLYRIIGVCIILLGLYLGISLLLFQHNLELETILSNLKKAWSSTEIRRAISFLIWSNLFLKILFIILHFITGYFLITTKSLCRGFANILGLCYVINTFFNFALLGSVYRMTDIILTILFIITYFVIMNSKTIRYNYPVYKSFKIVYVLLISVLLISIISYTHYLRKNTNETAGFETSKSKPATFKHEDLITFDIPPYISVSLPEDNVKFYMLYLSGKQPTFNFIIPQDSLGVIFTDDTILQNIYRKLIPKSNYDQISSARKVVKERYGLLYQLINNRLSDAQLIDSPFRNYFNNELEVLYFHIDDCGRFCYYFEDKPVYGITFIKMNSGNSPAPIDYNPQLIEHIGSSVKIISNDKTASDYLADGLNYYDQKKYKRAIFSLISSMILDNKNSVTNLYLAKSIIEADDSMFHRPSSIRYTALGYLDTAIDLDPNNIEAKKLLYKLDPDYEKELIE